MSVVRVYRRLNDYSRAQNVYQEFKSCLESKRVMCLSLTARGGFSGRSDFIRCGCERKAIGRAAIDSEEESPSILKSRELAFHRGNVYLGCTIAFFV